MDNTQIEHVINDLIFIREKLYNGIFGNTSTPALTEAIRLLRELQAIKISQVLKGEINSNG